MKFPYYFSLKKKEKQEKGAQRKEWQRENDQMESLDPKLIGFIILGVVIIFLFLGWLVTIVKHIYQGCLIAVGLRDPISPVSREVLPQYSGPSPPLPTRSATRSSRERSQSTTRRDRSNILPRLNTSSRSNPRSNSTRSNTSGNATSDSTNNTSTRRENNWMIQIKNWISERRAETSGNDIHLNSTDGNISSNVVTRHVQTNNRSSRNPHSVRIRVTRTISTHQISTDDSATGIEPHINHAHEHRRRHTSNITSSIGLIPNQLSDMSSTEVLLPPYSAIEPIIRSPPPSYDAALLMSSPSSVRDTPFNNPANTVNNTPGSVLSLSLRRSPRDISSSTTNLNSIQISPGSPRYLV